MDCPKVHAVGNHSPSITPVYTRDSLQNQFTLDHSLTLWTETMAHQPQFPIHYFIVIQLGFTCMPHLFLSKYPFRFTCHLSSVPFICHDSLLTICYFAVTHTLHHYLSPHCSESPSVLYYSHWWRQLHGCWNLWQIIPLIWLVKISNRIIIYYYLSDRVWYIFTMEWHSYCMYMEWTPHGTIL